jgi:hypothetical protein
MFSDTFAGIAPSSAPGFIAAQLVGGGVGLALVRLLYPHLDRAEASAAVVPHQATLGCGGFVRHCLLASSDTAGHVSVPRMLVCVDTASAPDGCQVVRCFVAWARR